MYQNNKICGRDEAYFNAIKSELTSAELELCDWMSNHLELVRREVSPVAEEVSGVGILFTNELYFPVSYEHDDMPTARNEFVVSRFPGFLMPRSGGRQHLNETKDALQTFMVHVDSAMRYKNYAELIDLCHFTLWTKEVVGGYTSIFGREVRDKLYKQLADSFKVDIVEADRFANTMRSATTIVGMGYNVPSSLKQIVDGVPAFGLLANNPLKQVKGFAELLYSKDAWDAMSELSESDIIPSRLSGGMNEQMDALIKAGRSGGISAAPKWLKSIGMSRLYRAFVNNAMTMTAFMDRLACLSGGSVYYRLKKNEYLNQGNTEADARRLALADTDIAIQRLQSSSRQPYLHELQRGKPTGRMLAQFLGPALHRVGLELDLAHRAFFVEKGDAKKDAFKKLFEKLVTAHVVIPTFLTLLDYGFQMFAPSFPSEDDDELRERMAVMWASSMLLGPFAGMLFYGDFLKGSLSAVISKMTGLKTRIIDADGSIAPSIELPSRIIKGTSDLASGFIEASPFGEGDWHDAATGFLKFCRILPPGNLVYKTLRGSDIIEEKKD